MSRYDEMKQDTVKRIIAGITRCYREAKESNATKPPTDTDIIAVLTRNGPDSPDYVSERTFKRHKKNDPQIVEVLEGMQESFTPFRDPETDQDNPAFLRRVIREQARAIGRLATRITQLETVERGLVPNDLEGIDDYE